MKFFLLILLTASMFLGSLDARPADDVVESRLTSNIPTTWSLPTFPTNSIFLALTSPVLHRDVYNFDLNSNSNFGQPQQQLQLLHSNQFLILTPQPRIRPVPEKFLKSGTFAVGLNGNQFPDEGYSGCEELDEAQVVSEETTIPLMKKMKMKSRKVGKGNVKVVATGKTSADKPFPVEFPFDVYFPPAVQKKSTKKRPASLILEPHAKALVGNGGTAISTPISRAVLKRGVPTNVYFNPESVAIAGVGGKAHAQADLILDLISRRRRR